MLEMKRVLSFMAILITVLATASVLLFVTGRNREETPAEVKHAPETHSLAPEEKTAAADSGQEVGQAATASAVERLKSEADAEKTRQAADVDVPAAGQPEANQESTPVPNREAPEKAPVQTSEASSSEESRAELAAVETAPLPEPPPHELFIEPSTLWCVSFQLKVKDGAELTIRPWYRKVGETDWMQALDLFRMSRKYIGKMIPRSWNMFAGSIFGLEENTGYEVRFDYLRGEELAGQETVEVKTWKEPRAPEPKRVLYVRPGSGGGKGTKSSPFRGIKAANKAAQPGDLFILKRGTYKGTVSFTTSGEPAAPIVWRVEDKDVGRVIIDGRGNERAVSAGGIHDVFFEGLTVRNSRWGMVLHDSTNIVIRKCIIREVHSGITGCRKAGRIFIADCKISGVLKWPHSGKESEDRGVTLEGAGHIVMHNEIHNFKDAVDTISSNGGLHTYAFDICYNEIYLCMDDGIEQDYSLCNTRSYYNRLTNCFQGISFQPIFGGPAYSFRNALFNIDHEPFKLHSCGNLEPYGGVILHNTIYKAGMPAFVYCSTAFHDFTILNNLYVGTTGNYAAEYCAPGDNSRLDGNAYVTDNVRNFFKWRGKIYSTREELAEAAGQEKHGLFIKGQKGIFLKNPPRIRDAAGQKFSTDNNDLRIRLGAPVADKALQLPNINDHFTGKAPDIGCYEAGDELPQYGPRR